jgi:hypothetical protein
MDPTPAPEPTPDPELPKWAEWLVRGAAVIFLLGCSGLMVWGVVWGVPKWWAEGRPSTVWGWALLLVPLAWGTYRIWTKEEPPKG